MYADYHIHTEFSDDSREPMENQIEKAIALGLEEICFTDHVDYGIKKDWADGNIQWREGDGVSYDTSQKDPIANVNYPEYFGKILRMREAFKDRICIRQFKHYSVLAHLDLIVRYDKCGRYPFSEVRDLIAEILRTAIADGKGIEVNTSSWHYGLPDTMPSGDILRLYKDLGGRIVTIGSDAHTTKYLADHVKNSQSILKKIGFKEICTFDHMTPIFHKL